MSGVIAAVAGAAVIGAGATVYAANKSASATEDASNNAIAEQKSALTQQEQLEQPYNNIGTSAIPTYQSLLGIGANGGALTPQSAQLQQQTLSQMPGYQFQLNQGLTSTKNAATASGLSMSGNTLQALDQYSTGLADSSYQQELGDVQGAVGIGQAAASGTAANIGSTANNVANETIAQGNNIAGIDANEIAGITKATGNAANQYTTQQTLADIYGTNPGSASSLTSGGGGTMQVGSNLSGGGGYTTYVPG